MGGGATGLWVGLGCILYDAGGLMGALFHTGIINEGQRGPSGLLSYIQCPLYGVMVRDVAVPKPDILEGASVEYDEDGKWQTCPP